MRYKFYHIPVVNSERLESELNQFCMTHHVLQVDKQFVSDAANSFWAICVSWSDNVGSFAASVTKSQ